MDYKEKLRQFNSTEKYQKELDFLYALFGKDFNSVLDFGCGNLYAVEQFNKRKKAFFGYDVVNYTGKQYADKLGVYDIVYFMHSLAHISNIKEVLNELQTKYFIVITPNKDWLDKQDKTNYNPDITVINHYNMKELKELFTSIGCEIIVSGNLNDGERIFIKAKKM